MTTSAIAAEIDQVRRSAPLQTIVIPPCPELLARLQATMAVPEPDLNEVARIASSDVAMAAVLLRQANGPMFAAGQPVQTVGQAMNRLGLEHTASVMTGFLAQRAIKVNSVHLQRFWERAAKRAIAMTFMAQKFPGMSTDIAHTYGLFCHVGLPVMMQSVPGYSGTLVEARARRDRSPIETENANHKTDHAVVGALVARVWRLAPQVMAAIRLHHDLDVLGDSHTDSEVQMLVAVGLLAEHVMLKHEGLEPDRDWVEHADHALGWLELARDELDVWDLELRDLLDAA
ncbi:MAG: HDOD domain-containing protein [Burkholderiales bacterium]|nr:HDOD domain-containing protein [Burkholderiales bacterium]